MTTKSCQTCFFKQFEKDREPCTNCWDFLTNTYRNYCTDSDDFWKDKEPVKDTYQPSEVATTASLQAGEWPYPEETPKAPEKTFDVVSKPKHYMLFEEKNIEVRDVVNRLLERMEDSMAWEFTAVDYVDYAQLMQYLMRFMDKNGKEDLEKAQWYLSRIIENWEDK